MKKAKIKNFCHFLCLPKENNEKKCTSFFAYTKERSKETSFFKTSFINFLVSQQESNKEMRPLKRRGRLAAHKVPNFIRHTVSELISLPIKGKT
ncbi:MAG: hypothetical protein U0I40_07530 [Oscillospiraceae bacterium]|nr:hypothetical protein [Oscillospiraceae bacterium]